MIIPALRDEMLTLLTNTTNLTATEKTKLRNRFAAAYATEYQRFLTANGLTDTAANKGAFVVYKTIVGFWGDIYKAGSVAENQAAVPPPDTFE